MKQSRIPYTPAYFPIYLFALLQLILAWGCGEKKLVRVAPYSSETAQASHNLVYYLPTTELDICFTVVHERFTPGPYASFCERFLGFTPSQQNTEPLYRITHVSVAPRQEADLTHPFVAQLYAPNTPLFLQLSERGLLFPSQQNYVAAASTQSVANKPQEHQYTDLSSQPFIDSERSVLQSVKQSDSSFVSVPVTREVSVKRSLEEKARQAAEQIFFLRKRRLDLLAGDDMPTTPNGISVVLNEIARLEIEYLSLFMGKTLYDTLYSHVYFTPSADAASAIVCRFSPNMGIVSSGSMMASPILFRAQLELEKTHINWSELPTLQNAYYYRAQRPVSIELVLGADMLYQGRIAFSQYGELLHAPLMLQLPR